MAKKVNVIPATRKLFSAEPVVSTRKRRVAGYARVSTDHEEQATSYDAQVKYYTEYIKGRDDWEFVDIYTDEGISATSTAHREGFKQMIADALDGKIDLIITKSVSRFARNTVDSLTTIRELKEHGTEVYFEKENIWTLDSKGELLITIMSSLAQEESRSISENTTWGQRRRFAEGKASVAYSHFLGYDEGFKVNEEQAKTVRRIYKEFLSGLSCTSIARRLEKEGIPAPAGGKRWHGDSVQSILTNEKYMGDALLQKRYTVDFLTKKLAINNGEVPQYYVEGHHEGIIDEGTFRVVQAEMHKRKKKPRSHRNMTIYSSKVICGECGGFYGRKIWHSTDKYRHVIWQCNERYKRPKGQRCSTPSLSEEEMQDAFLKALNSLNAERKEVLENARMLQAMAADTEAMKSELETVGAEMQGLLKRIDAFVSENVHTEQGQEEYEAMVRHYEEKEARQKELQERIADAKANVQLIGNFIKRFEKAGAEEFDESVWGGLIDHVTVYAKKKIEVTFIGGFKVTV